MNILTDPGTRMCGASRENRRAVYGLCPGRVQCLWLMGGHSPGWPEAEMRPDYTIRVVAPGSYLLRTRDGSYREPRVPYFPWRDGVAAVCVYVAGGGRRSICEGSRGRQRGAVVHRGCGDHEWMPGSSMSLFSIFD